MQGSKNFFHTGSHDLCVCSRYGKSHDPSKTKSHGLVLAGMLHSLSKVIATAIICVKIQWTEFELRYDVKLQEAMDTEKVRATFCILMSTASVLHCK